MTTLGKECQNTIRNLEKLRDSQYPPSDEILATLDIMYEQQINLIDANIKKNTEEYKEATEGMKEAAKKTKEVVDGLAKLNKSIDKIANAIGKVSKLISKVV